MVANEVLRQVISYLIKFLLLNGQINFGAPSVSGLRMINGYEVVNFFNRLKDPILDF